MDNFQEIDPTRVPKKETACWDDASTEALISEYRRIHLRLNKGHLEYKHWKEIALNIRQHCSWNVDRQQCKYKIEALKKRYKKERMEKSSTGSGACTWAWFDVFDEFMHSAAKVVRVPAKVVRVPGACDPGLALFKDVSAEAVDRDSVAESMFSVPISRPESQHSEPIAATPDQIIEDTACTSPRQQTVKNEDHGEHDVNEKVENPPEVAAKRNGSGGKNSGGKKKNRLLQLGADFKEGMQSFCEVLSKIEAAKMENAREIENQKLLMQREIEKDRREMERQRQEFQLQMSLQFAKILVKNKKRKASPSSSDSE